MGYFYEQDPADREVARADYSGLIVRVGPDSYDRNDCIKVADPFHDFERKADAEWVLELRPSEVRDLVRMLMTALDNI